MAHLGSFGQAPAEREPITFEWFGQTIRANPALGELDFIEFMAAAGHLDVTDMSSLKIVRDFAQTCIHPEDFDGFWSAAKANRQSAEAVFGVLMAITEEWTDRPTERPSDSSDGPSTTGTRSGGDVFSQALADPRLAHRPDLKLAVLRAQRQAAAG